MAIPDEDMQLGLLGNFIELLGNFYKDAVMAYVL